VHPSRDQAEAGYRAENERGLPPGDKSRNYVDDWPKPEILCALTTFEVLAGMRAPADAAALLRVLNVAELGPTADNLAETAAPAALSHALATILTWPNEGHGTLITSVVAACERVVAEGGEYAAACAATARLAAEHPGDLGIVGSLLMRHTVLAPGEAVFLPANGLHSYLHGTGIELLANSDNVVRAGLTAKHVDVPELLKLTDPAVAVPVVEPRPAGGGIWVYDSPAPEFRLYRAETGHAGLTLPGDGARIALCTDGTGMLRASSGTLKVAKGESCYLSAADGAVTAAGPATLFVAGTGNTRGPAGSQRQRLPGRELGQRQPGQAPLAEQAAGQAQADVAEQHLVDLDDLLRSHRAHVVGGLGDLHPRSAGRQQQGGHRGVRHEERVTRVVQAAVDQVANVRDPRDVWVDLRVLVAVHPDVEGRHGELVARRDRGELVGVGTEHPAQRARRVHPQPGPRRERLGDRRLVDVVEVLVREENRVGARDDLRGAGGERAGVDDDLRAVLLQHNAGMLVLGQLHGAQLPLLTFVHVRFR
jgi:mannose-6-phosphate isomerase